MKSKRQKLRNRVALIYLMFVILFISICVILILSEKSWIEKHNRILEEKEYYKEQFTNSCELNNLLIDELNFFVRNNQNYVLQKLNCEILASV